MQPTPASAFTQRLSALAKLTNRPVVRRRLPLPAHIEIHGWTVSAILRPNFLRAFGKVLP